VRRLAQRLLAGDRRGSLEVIDAALLHGNYDDVLVEVLAPALRAIGDQWEAGTIDVADEHRASELALDLLHHVGARFTRRGRRRGTAVIGCAPGERHAMPAALVASAMRSNGFGVDWLGPDVPATSFLAAARVHSDLVAVGISVSSPALADSIPTIITLLRRAGIIAPVLVGGAGIPDAVRAADLSADAYAPDARAAVDVLAQLHVSREPPRSRP
jgi:methanogenic corrinoid protein MtbC1